MKLPNGASLTLPDQSHPARGAWIETLLLPLLPVRYAVAPREGCVD